jgi:hypothetical protein
MFVLITVLLILSLIVNGFLVYALRAQLKKISVYQSLLNDTTQWIDGIKSDVASTYLKMKAVDDKNLFFKDDDVGFVFQELLNLLKKLRDKTE